MLGHDLGNLVVILYYKHERGREKIRDSTFSSSKMM